MRYTGVKVLELRSVSFASVVIWKIPLFARTFSSGLFFAPPGQPEAATPQAHGRPECCAN